MKEADRATLMRMAAFELFRWPREAKQAMGVVA